MLERRTLQPFANGAQYMNTNLGLKTNTIGKLTWSINAQEAKKWL